MKKILWLSRHQPLSSQVEALCRHFEKIKMVQDAEPFSSAEEIVSRYRKGGYDEIVAVAPMSVISKLVDLGIKPLWAEMIQVNSQAEAEVEANGRFYRFVRFRRIKALRFEFEEL